MKKHIYILLMIAIPLLAQRSERRVSASKSNNDQSSLIQESSTISVPRRISYQGILTKTNGQPAADKSYEVKFRLYKQLDGGDSFWEETQQVYINDGLLSATLGIVNELAIIPSSAFLEVEVEGSVLQPRQEMTAVFYSIIADTAYHAKGYTQTVDMAAVSLSGDYYDLNNLPEIGSIAQQDSAQINIKGGTIDAVVIGADSASSANFTEVDVAGSVTAGVFVGSAAGLTGILADSLGVISGQSPLAMEGLTYDDNEMVFTIEDPTEDRIINIPDVSGTMITTGNDENIDAVGTIEGGTWNADPIGDTYVNEDLTVLGGTIDSTIIGDSIPALGRFTTITTQEGINIDDGNTVLSNVELGVLDEVVQ